jgi:hypothetical protein
MLQNTLNLAENIGKFISNNFFSSSNKTIKNKKNRKTNKPTNIKGKTFYKLMFFKNNQN